MTYKIMGWAAVVVLSVALSTAAVTPSAQAADNGKTVASAPRLVLKLSGMSFADGSKVRAATVTTRAGARVPAGTQGATSNTCYLGGSLPSLLPTEDPFTENVYFPASFRCDLDVVGTPELTAALQSGFMGSYTTEKIVGPYRGNPVGVGVILEKNCIEIPLGTWRGAAHPRLIQDAVIYDWGWIVTYDSSLGC
jgi:hypothetical protein